ncbi:hypothetical protein WN943_016247 [Citrus x changshan-huyou]
MFSYPYLYFFFFFAVYGTHLFICLFTILCFFSIFALYRKDIGFQETPFCKTTVQGRYLLSDDNG